jgi:hypothetical protein
MSKVSVHLSTMSELRSREVVQETSLEVIAAAEREVEQVADCHLLHSEWR